jgi:uncharacterized protein
MRVLISGSSGLIGRELSRRLRERGDEVVRLVRPQTRDKSGSITWDPLKGEANPADFEGFDAVFHLAGENVAERRWSPEQKRRLRDSRVETTKLLTKTLLSTKQKPKVVLSASAVGYYGDRGNQVLTEESAAGNGFLPEVSIEWEKATDPLSAAGIRVVLLRFGIVLSSKGGAAQHMLLPFKLGVGGTLGSGDQYWSWIGLGDAIRALLFLLDNEQHAGPVNIAAPEPATNREFTKALGKHLHRPTILPVPTFALRIVFGEMADEALLAGARVVPRKLLDAGFNYEHPNLQDALAAEV